MDELNLRMILADPETNGVDTDKWAFNYYEENPNLPNQMMQNDIFFGSDD